MQGRYFLVFSANSSLFYWAKVHLHPKCLKSLTAQHTESCSHSLSQPRALWKAKQTDNSTEDFSERQSFLKVQKHVRNLDLERPRSTEILLILKEARYLGNCIGYRFFFLFKKLLFLLCELRFWFPITAGKSELVAFSKHLASSGWQNSSWRHVSHLLGGMRHDMSNQLQKYHNTLLQYAWKKFHLVSL